MQDLVKNCKKKYEKSAQYANIFDKKKKKEQTS